MAEAPRVPEETFVQTAARYDRMAAMVAAVLKQQTAENSGAMVTLRALAIQIAEMAKLQGRGKLTAEAAREVLITLSGDPELAAAAAAGRETSAALRLGPSGHGEPRLAEVGAVRASRLPVAGVDL